MKLKKALEIEDKSYKKRRSIRIKKGKDYAKEEDCLQNFKKVARIAKILEIDVTKSYGVAMFYKILKIDRLCNLVFRKKEINPENESLIDNIDDELNYTELFRETLIEEFFDKGD